MDLASIHQRLQHYHQQGKVMFITSSFQTHSIPLLHILSTAGVPVTVLFIHTGFHFPETLQFRDEVSALLGLQTIDVRSQVPKNLQRDAEGQFYYVSDPDYCCYLNKVQPLEPYLQTHDIWINGVRADQSKQRAALQVEQPAPFNTLRFHPMLDWDARRIYRYRTEHQLPEHPLDALGYVSIGCEPCTRKLMPGDERSARWFGMNKTECGLHTELVRSNENNHA